MRPSTKRSTLNRRIASSAAAPTLTMEWRSTVPPIRITSTFRCGSSAEAIVGLCVTMVAVRSSGRCRTSSKLVVPPSMKTVWPARPARRRHAPAALVLGRQVAARFEVRHRGRGRQRSAMDAAAAGPRRRAPGDRGGWCLPTGSARRSSPWRRCVRRASDGREGVACAVQSALHDFSCYCTIYPDTSSTLCNSRRNAT